MFRKEFWRVFKKESLLMASKKAIEAKVSIFDSVAVKDTTHTGLKSSQEYLVSESNQVQRVLDSFYSLTRTLLVCS
jgi:hypothetical protein